MTWLGPGLTLPSAFGDRLSGYRARGSFQGDDAETFRVERPGFPTLYLKKRADPPELEPMAVERFVLHRLQGTGLAVPRVVHFQRIDDTEWLLMSALPGKNLVEALDEGLRPQAVVEAIAGAITRIHATRPTWPEDINAIPYRLEAARERVRAGLADRTVLRRFEARYREPEERVFVHGDLCLPNLLVEDGALSGIVDWGRAGYGDPYQDLALAVRSLEHNLGPGDWGRRLGEACGLGELDCERLELWTSFDELF